MLLPWVVNRSPTKDYKILRVPQVVEGPQLGEIFNLLPFLPQGQSRMDFPISIIFESYFQVIKAVSINVLLRTLLPLVLIFGFPDWVSVIHDVDQVTIELSGALYCPLLVGVLFEVEYLVWDMYFQVQKHGVRYLME